MVKVREEHPVDTTGRVDIDSWVNNLISVHSMENVDADLLKKACRVCSKAEEDTRDAPNVWSDMGSSFLVGLEMAQILAELKLDCETLQAAILYRAVRENRLLLENVEKEFGGTVVKLISGVQKMAAISTRRNDTYSNVLGQAAEYQSDNVRKMLVAMVDDVRVALIKLAERTCIIRIIKDGSEERKQRVAREVVDIYAPLAQRLGIGHIKWELEDISFRYLESHDYMNIAKLLDEKRLHRQSYIEDVIDKLQTDLSKADIKADVFGRAKHIYSIWKKMQRKGIGFSQVYDVRAVRILVPTVRDCYAVLGIVHSLWRNIPNEFDDYIASPKENGYRSLHTAVIGHESKVLEVQIRTNAMHEEAEYGVCAHWLYKGTDAKGSEESYEQKIEWLRQVLEWHEELGGNPLQEDLTTEIQQDRIYVFTPEGHVIDLPKGSTPLDFAYRVHTEIGHRCSGAKVNGRIVPLNHCLNTSDQVEVLTSKRESPSRDWLSPALGYLKTGRARAKVHHWFKLQARDQNISDGRAVLDKEFRRLALNDLNYQVLAEKLNLATLDDLYAAVGASDIGVGSVLNTAQKILESNTSQEQQIPLFAKVDPTTHGSDLYIDGVGNLLTHIASCCHSVPGDAIAGYITLGRGISIHRQDCSNILQLQADEPERVIQVSWGSAPQNYYSVDVIVEAFDRNGLLRDITIVLDSEKVNISSMQTISDKRKNTVDMQFTLEIRGFNELSHVLSKINQLTNVASARRKH